MDRAKPKSKRISFQESLYGPPPKGDDLEKYLLEPPYRGNMDILSWWRLNESQYPDLSKMARDYLGIPGTSTPSERRFSAGEGLITKKRTRLAEKTVQASMCLHDWWVRTSIAERRKNWLEEQLEDPQDVAPDVEEESDMEY